MINHRIGDVLAQKGGVRFAEDVYQSSLRIATQLAEHDPSNTQLQRDLSASYEKIGSVLEDQGKTEGALGSYQASLAITKRLVADDPEKLPLQHDLRLSLENVGRVLLKRGQPRDAVQHYQHSAAVLDQLAAAEPANIELKRGLIWTYERIGNLLDQQGQRDAARAAYRASHAIAESLATAEPTNAEWKYLSYRELGLIRESEGKAKQAGELYCLARDMAEDSLSHSSGADATRRQWKKRKDWVDDHLAVVQDRGAATCHTASSDRTGLTGSNNL